MKNIILVSENIPREAETALEGFGYSVVPLPRFDRLAEPVASHADMLVYMLSDGSMLTYEAYYNARRTLFDSLGIRVVTTGESVSPDYPNDVALNALRLYKTVFGRSESLSEYILRDAERVVSVRQGYARCSCCVIDASCIVTADIGIANAVMSEGREALLIRAGGIRLDGYGYGFIGGASVTLNGAVGFFGKISSHPDYKKIAAAVENHGIDIIELCGGDLIDVGGAVII